MSNKFQKPYVARQDATVTTPKAASKEEPGIIMSLVNQYGPAIPALLSNNPYTMALMALYDYEMGNRPEAYDPDFAVTGPTEISQYETPRQRMQSGKEDLMSMYGGEDPGMLVMGGAGAHSIEQLWGKTGKEALPKIREMRQRMRQPKLTPKQQADILLGLEKPPAPIYGRGAPKPLTGSTPEESRWRQGIEMDRARVPGRDERLSERNSQVNKVWGDDTPTGYGDYQPPSLEKLYSDFDGWPYSKLLKVSEDNQFVTDADMYRFAKENETFGGARKEPSGALSGWSASLPGSSDQVYHLDALSYPPMLDYNGALEYSSRIIPYSQIVARNTIKYLEDAAKTEVGSGGDIVLPALYATGPRKWMLNKLMQNGITTQEEAIKMMNDPKFLSEANKAFGGFRFND